MTARNDLGESNATISLNFDSEDAADQATSTTTSSSKTTRKTSKKTSVTTVRTGKRPAFTERPVIRQDSEDESKILFECRLAADPKPDVAW